MVRGLRSTQHRYRVVAHQGINAHQGEVLLNLAWLLALNAERYAEEVALGLHSKGAKQAAKASRAVGGSAPGGKGRGRPAKTTTQPSETEPMQTEQMGLGL